MQISIWVEVGCDKNLNFTNPNSFLYIKLAPESKTYMVSVATICTRSDKWSACDWQFILTTLIIMKEQDGRNQILRHSFFYSSRQQF